MNETKIKPLSITFSGVKKETCFPNFDGRPRRIRLDPIVAVRGYGKLKIRPIQMVDEPGMVRFHEHVSDENIYMRYFEYLGLDRRTTHERLLQICTNTPDSYAVVVEKPASFQHSMEILAVGRLSKTEKPYVTTFDILMTDDAHNSKLGKVLLNRLIKLARAFGFLILSGELLVADHDGLNLCRALGFSLQTLPGDGLVRVTYNL